MSTLWRGEGETSADRWVPMVRSRRFSPNAGRRGPRGACEASYRGTVVLQGRGRGFRFQLLLGCVST